MRNPKFTTKEEYLQYRKDWKNEYIELSQQIRDYKLINRYSTQDCNKAIPMVGGRLEYHNINQFHRHVHQLNSENFKLKELVKKYNYKTILMYKLRINARIMMEELKNAKIEANKQYLKSKNLVSA